MAQGPAVPSLRSPETAPDRMTPYAWWVLFIGAASWLFDCMDQRIFVLSRSPALRTLLASYVAPLSEAQQKMEIEKHGAYVTAAMVAGWALGGLFFGVMGDKWGRVRTLSTSILVYSLFTGLSGLATAWGDFLLWRFLMGCGIGGAFATAATLIAETMPARYRPIALGSFQALSATGNILGAAIAWLVLTPDKTYALFGSEVPGWRLLFFVGVLPAFLIFAIVRTIREPASWHAARASAKEQIDRQLGDLKSMARTPRWRRNAIVGVVLSIAGVVGLWGVGFWTPELIQEAMTGSPPGEVGKVKALAMLFQDCGAVLGVLFFTALAVWVGRKASFAACFVLAYGVVAFVFLSLREKAQAYWMAPLVGFATLSVFGGYAVYFPELFPTRLRSTGTAICYNVGRIVSAAIILFWAPLQNWGLGALERHGEALRSLGATSPFRAAAIILATVYFVGVVAIIWAPETRGKPLPTDDGA